MKPLLIVNPAAGGGKAGQTLHALQPVVERILGPVDLALTARAGHAIGLARNAAVEGRELIVAVGGDGTLHEVANGVLDAQVEKGAKTALGLVAQGTGGDFRKSLGLEHRLDRYLEAIASGREQKVDAVRATFQMTEGGTRTKVTRWFLNILSVGMGGLVDRFVVDAPRAFSPGVAYLWASVRAAAAYEPAPLRCVVERGGERIENVLSPWVVGVCNGTTFGAGMRIAPMASVKDGRLEVVALSAPSMLSFARLSRKLYTGSHVGEPGVFHLSGEKVRIEAVRDGVGAPIFLDVDGEPLGELPLEVEVVPGALRVRA